MSVPSARFGSRPSPWPRILPFTVAVLHLHTGGDAASICGACTCALVDVYRPALVAGGITFDPEDPTTFPLEATANILRACSEQYIVSMLMANVDVQALAGLTNCTYTSGSVPRCALPCIKDILLLLTVLPVMVLARACGVCECVAEHVSVCLCFVAACLRCLALSCLACCCYCSPGAQQQLPGPRPERHRRWQRHCGGQQP